MRFLQFFLITFFLFVWNNASSAERDGKIDQWKRGVVSITTEVIKSPYLHTGEFFGTGFIIDKERGIIVTNKHVVNGNNINDIMISFHNGREIRAQLLYSDPQHDFTFLIVPPKSLPNDSIPLKLSRSIPKIDDLITIIGNNEGQGFSIQTGYVTSLYESSNYFPDQTLRISLNTRGGSSGSPIINQRGDVIAINYAVDNTYAYSLYASYLIDAYNQLIQDKIPSRKSMGILLDYMQLDKAASTFKLPTNVVNSYEAKFPDAHSKIMIVDSVMSGVPAESILQSGDVIYEVEGEVMGPGLYQFQKIIDGAKSSVKMRIFRQGKLLNVDVPVYDLEQHNIRKMLSMDSSIYFEADEFMQLLYGVQAGSVFVVNVGKSSNLFNIDTLVVDGSPGYALQIVAINDQPIKSLDDIIALIPKLKSEQYFNISYINYAGQSGYNKSIYFSRVVRKAEMQLSPYDEESTLFEYNAKDRNWSAKKI